jgi:hypothetical protein
MRAGGGPSKGASFERDVCKALSLWLSQGEKDDLLWRTAMSGGRATINNRKKAGSNTNQLGDICAISTAGNWLTRNFFIECKHVKNLHTDRLMDFKSYGGVSQFWDKAYCEAKANRRLPMMVCQDRHRPTYVLLNGAGVALLKLTLFERVYFRPKDCYLFEFDTFLDMARGKTK